MSSQSAAGKLFHSETAVTGWWQTTHVHETGTRIKLESKLCSPDTQESGISNVVSDDMSSFIGKHRQSIITPERLGSDILVPFSRMENLGCTISFYTVSQKKTSHLL